LSLQITTDPVEAVDAHLHAFFAGHRIESLTQETGPIGQRVPDFRVHAVAPGPRFPGLWTYITTGCWQAADQDGHGIEFVLATRRFTMRAVELLAMNAYYHAGPPDQRLDIGHTVPIGEPWLPGSACDHALISSPYPWGGDLEVCDWVGGHARLLWYLPITEAERDHKRDRGLDALEQRFEDARLDFADPHRPSVA
jgi:Suppressor of fused protein (SUFU)